MMTFDDWMADEGHNESTAAAALGVAPSTVNRVRSGKSPATPAFIERCIIASGGRIDARSFFAAAYEKAAA